jgi:hypothetical protein
MTCKRHKQHFKPKYTVNQSYFSGSTYTPFSIIFKDYSCNKNLNICPHLVCHVSTFLCGILNVICLQKNVKKGRALTGATNVRESRNSLLEQIRKYFF